MARGGSRKGRDGAAEAAVEETARRILATAKYGALDPAFVRRVAGEAVERSGEGAQALKYAKRKLHQAFGAFLTGRPADAAAEAARAVAAGRLDPREACLTAMRAHASTAERLPQLDAFYARVAAWCGEPASVADLACGLNPLAVPWMRLAPDCAYWFCDIDESLVAALRGLDGALPAVRLDGATRDLVASPPAVTAEVALVLKALTTVERQEAGAAHRVLAALDCAHVVVTLPRRSLSGRREYTDDARALLERAAEGTRYGLADEDQLGDELLCHLTPAPEPAAVAPAPAPAPEPAPAPAPEPVPEPVPEPTPGRNGGLLTLVATPIGNLGDLGGCALRALREADVVCAEDTRRTRKLLSAYGVHPPRLVSVREHNELAQAATVARWLAEGRRVALVSDAGMPTLSDPGQRLTRRVLDAGGAVAVAPGPDAATTALALAGIPAERWCFEGFLPVKGAARARRLAALAREERAAVLYEAPHRLLGTLADLVDALGPDRPAAVLNDLTKRFERVWRGPLGSLAERIAEQQPQPRGEFVLVLSGNPEELVGLE